MNRLLTTFLLTLSLLAASAAPAELYKDESAPTADRARDLLSRMSVDEKIKLLYATSPANERLGIPKYYMGNEALHGVIRPGHFTVFPQAIGLASTWNPQLINEISTAISDEARGRWNALNQGADQREWFTDLLVFWSPTVNMARDPRWGRTPETYGEDPFLSGIIGTEFVKGLQGDDPRYLKIVATPKHFATNNEEHNRFSCNVRVNERNLREYYLPAFEMLVKDGKARSIMSAYPAINDVPCSANPWLLNKVLRDDWGFDGYVVSDCGAPSMLVWAHNYVKTKEAAATLAIKSGLDVECGDDVFAYALKNAYNMGMVNDADIDSAAYRVLKARIDLGMLDPSDANPYKHIPESVVGCEKHQQLALEAARQSIVLLKNDKNMLPLNPKKIKKIAVVGNNADRAEFGDYSGLSVIEPVSVLKGIRNYAEPLGIEVVHAPWKSAADGLEIIQGDNFPNGLKAEYYFNTNFEGDPKVRQESWVNFEPANQAPDPFIPVTNYSVRWSGVLRPTVSGDYDFCLTSDQGARLIIDGQTIIDAWGGHAAQNDFGHMRLEAGKDYNMVVEFYDTRDYTVCRLQWKVPSQPKATRMELYGNAGEAARDADLVIAVMGINKGIEREGQDRSEITLPADQREFLQEIHKVNPNLVTVLVAGSSLALTDENETLPAIVNAWYPGESGGTAVAEVLFGEYNPAGRLPLTYYKSMEDLPAFDDYDITKGRTYQYFTGDVLYPFGYGLSYTKFDYRDLSLEDAGDVVNVTFTLRNSGRRDGDEVAQVYVKLPAQDGRVMPLKELKGFERVSLPKGKKQKVTIPVRKDLLRFWDENQGKFITPAGTYTFMVGGNSASLPVSAEITL